MTEQQSSFVTHDNDSQNQKIRRKRRLTGIPGLIMLLVLVALLIGVNALYEPAVTWQTIMTGEPGETLYAAGFDGFVDEWQQYDGRLAAHVQDSVLRIEVNKGLSLPYSVAAPIFADFDAQVTATAVDGPEDNGYGLIFRLQTAQNPCAMPLKVLCDLSEIDAFGVPLRLLFPAQTDDTSGFYMFLISSDGYYSIWKRDAATDSATQLMNWMPSDAIRTGIGATNTIRVVGRHNQFQFSINGLQVPLCIGEGSLYNAFSGECIGAELSEVFVDDDYTTGQIGVVAYTTSLENTGVVVEFDNVIITYPRNGDREENEQL